MEKKQQVWWVLILAFVDGHEDKDQQKRDDGHADDEFRHVGQSCAEAAMAVCC
jgi:hypothetical protein